MPAIARNMVVFVDEGKLWVELDDHSAHHIRKTDGGDMKVIAISKVRVENGNGLKALGLLFYDCGNPLQEDIEGLLLQAFQLGQKYPKAGK